MEKKKNRLKTLKSSHGFTILELLVVIVIIGILAVLTIASYVGTQASARDASVQSDVDRMDAIETNYGVKTVNGVMQNVTVVGKAYYSGNGYDAALGFTPSSGNVIDVVINSTDYCIRGYNPSGTKNSIFNAFTKESTPGVCSQISPSIAALNAATSRAPLNPVADWLSVTRGDHYGNFYDLVGKQSATVTRAGTKTIYDPSTHIVYSVPANNLGVNPRSDGKGGNEAVIEEARTNYLLNSSTDQGTNWTVCSSDGTTVQYNTSTAPDGTNTAATLNQGTGGAHCFRQTVSVSPSTTYTFSFFAKVGTATNAQYSIYDWTHSNDIIASTSYYSSVNNSSWSRVSVTFTTPSGCTSVGVYPERDSASTGTIYFWGMQLEAGAFATSYIPTTTTSVIRNADVVTVPTTGWSASSGSFFGVTGDRASYTNTGGILSWYKDSTNRIDIRNLNGSTYGQTEMYVYATSAWQSYGARASQGTFVTSGTWSNGSPATGYYNGSAFAPTSNVTTPTGMPGTATIGNAGGGSSIYYNGPISRAIIYSSSLSSSNVLNVYNAIKDGP